jgi:excinuclease ABC subunit C
MPFDITSLETFPQQPGVYIMRDAQGHCLYVGKAKSIRQRVKQYFVPGRDSRPIIPFLVKKVETIETIIVTSEKEALLLENNLIKQHQPKYNALLKDDKSYIALKLSKHKWPMLSLMRYKGKPAADGTYFGPYTSALAARQTFDLLNRLFPLRQCSDQELVRRTRPCILYDMKRCIAPCVGKCTKEEYDSYVDHTARFLRGQDKEILKDLYKELQAASDNLEFERAAELLKIIRQIETTIEQQRVDKPLGMDSDAIALFRQGDEVILTQMIYRGGKLIGSHNYDFCKILEEDAELIETFLLQQYRLTDDIPHEILLPLELENASTISDIISENKKRTTSIMTPQRGDKLLLVQMAQNNATEAFKREKDEQTILEKTLLEMQEKFHLMQCPIRIECFDNSNIAGTNPVAVMVAFTDGKKDTTRYRKYKIRTTDTSNDYALMEEVLTRRYTKAKEQNDLPDLIIIDGGKGHLNIALKVLATLNIVTAAVIGVAKEESRHDKGMSIEQVFLPGAKDPIILPRNSQLLFLLQRIRDEAHRFAITFHRKRRSKGLIKTAIQEIYGIGEIRKKALLRHFGSIKKLKEATIEQIMEVPSITRANAEMIYRTLHDTQNDSSAEFHT